VRSPICTGLPRTRARRGPLLPAHAVLAVGGLGLALLLCASAGRAQTPAAEAAGPAYPVTSFELAYREPHPDHPPVGRLLPITVELHATETGYVAPRPGEATERVRIASGEEPLRYFHASAIGVVSRRLVDALHREGLLGVYVLPSETDIELEGERDLRAAGDTGLRFEIWTGRVRDVRTLAVGDRVQGGWRVDNPIHRRIARNSPLQPAEAGREDTTDLLRQDLLEDYLFQLNRHPGRRVEAALAASEDGEGVSLDYRVIEPKPWVAYAQVADTGTPRTNPWQTRLGFIHRQVTSRDDILSIEYLNSGFNDVNGISASYQAPFFGRHRPDWMKSSGKEPSWIAWLDREKVPWWGIDRLRWSVSGGWSRFEAGSVTGVAGIPDAVDRFLARDWFLGGSLQHMSFQHKAFFLDTFVGARVRDVDVENLTLGPGNRGEALLFMPEGGIEMQRINEYSTLLARVSAEGGIVSDETGNFSAAQGRGATDEQWAVLHWDVGMSHYLEPLFDLAAWSDPETASSSTLAHEISLGLRGQYGFDYRLIPQVSQVIGGLYSVRGFPQGLASGDTVYVGSFEYRFHLPRALPIRREPLQLPWIGDFRVAPQQVYGRPDWDLVLRAFLDAGHSVQNQPDRAIGIESDQTLLSAGVGVELSFGGRVRARVDWGRGILHDQSISCTPGVQAACRQPDSAIDSSGELHFLFSLVY